MIQYDVCKGNKPIQIKQKTSRRSTILALTGIFYDVLTKEHYPKLDGISKCLANREDRLSQIISKEFSRGYLQGRLTHTKILREMIPQQETVS